MVQVARGKALVAKLRAQPGVRDPEALAAELGRKKALRNATKKATDKVKSSIKAVMDADENFNATGDISDSQASLLKSLLGRGKQNLPRDLEGSFKLRDRKESLLDYSMRLNAPLPKDKAAASKLIDDLKGSSLPRLTHLEDGDLTDFPEDFPPWSVTVGKKLQTKYGDNLAGLKEAINKRLKSLPKDKQKEIADGIPGSGEYYRKHVLNPILKV